MKRERKAAKTSSRGSQGEAADSNGPSDVDVAALIDAAIGDHTRHGDGDLAAHASTASLNVHTIGTERKQRAPAASSVTGRKRNVRRPDDNPESSRPIERNGGREPVNRAAENSGESEEKLRNASTSAPEIGRSDAYTTPPRMIEAKRANRQDRLLPTEVPNAIPASTTVEVADKAETAPPLPAAAPQSQPATRPEPTRHPATSTAPQSAPQPHPHTASQAALPDLDAATRNMGRLIEYSGKVTAAYLQPRESGDVKPSGGEDLSETFKTIGRVAESWLSNPARMIQAQAALSAQIFAVWTDTFSRFSGAGTATPPAPERKVDRRFAAPEWRETPMFDFLHQAYLATTDWANSMVKDADGIDEVTREKAAFYLRQISSAMSPANFLATNPELIKETLKENGENLVRGMKMLAEDIEAGGGDLKIRQSDSSKFKLGVDMAATPGKVIFRNELMELLQYAPATEDVLKRPLLIVPPWINKFYVLDLNREKSLIGWAVSQGLTVFVISWVNPDERHATKDWNAYMQEGIFAAVDAIETAIGETDVAAVGYCVGGTLLAATLAYMAQKGDHRVSSATFLTTQVDFEEAGDLKVFADEAQIRALEKEIASGGYLPGSKMANAFNMLRPDDLIWSYAVSAYLKGKPPAAFDLLAWNADSTRMTAANHAFYLRNCYLENRLAKGEMVIGGEKLRLGDITIPIYDLAAKEDHIAPARSVFKGAQFFGGPVRYVVAGSGHIAGVVNPPAKAKYQYWVDGAMGCGFDGWFSSARETKGTWWTDWIAWLKAQAPATVPHRVPGAGGLPALFDAPGEYVRAQS